MLSLDLKDKKILYELDSNSRQSISQIAKKIRLNKNTVNYKIKQMEKEKIISGYYTMVDITKLGYFMVRVYLKFFNTTKEKEKEIIDWAKRNEMIGVVAKSETIYDLVLMVWAKNIYEFDEFLFEFKKKFRPYLWQEKMHIFSKVWHFKRKYILQKDKPAEYEFVGSNKPEKFDETDFSILKILSKNARMPIIEISQKLNIPERTIAFRIRQLEKKKIIQGYRVNLNLNKIGYEYYKANLILSDFSKYNELFTFASNHPNVIYIDRTSSELDFEVDIEIENKQLLLNLINEIKSKFNVRESEICSFQEYYKIESLPEN
ncbi:MAG: Lrp/AsnC family transcriptional regulator [Nanoarchaeota archaeon]